MRVLIADPEVFFCEALAEVLGARADIDVVGWTTDERAAERTAAELLPDVLISEATLSPGSGLSLARRVGDRVGVLIVTRQQVGDLILDAVESGARGCVGHDLGVEQLADAIKDVGVGRFAVDRDHFHDVLRRVSANRDGLAAEPAAMARLTPREREVLRLLAQGLDNGAIGKQLYLSAHTVRTHVGNILRKLGAHSRAEAARIALRLGAADRGMPVLRIEGPKWRRP